MSAFYSPVNQTLPVTPWPTFAPAVPQALQKQVQLSPPTSLNYPTPADKPFYGTFHSDSLILNPTPVEKAHKTITLTQRLIPLANAAGLLLAAVMLRRLPTSPSTFTVISSDWKVWAKMALGMGVVSQVNQAANWKPPAWAVAMMNVAMIVPLMCKFGTTEAKKQLAKSLAILMPGVAGLVAGTNWVNAHAEKPLEERYNIPPAITRLVLSVSSTLLGIGVFHQIFKGMGLNLPITAACSRCGGSCSTVCATEIGEYVSALGGLVQPKAHERH